MAKLKRQLFLVFLQKQFSTVQSYAQLFLVFSKSNTVLSNPSHFVMTIKWVFISALFMKNQRFNEKLGHKFLHVIYWYYTSSNKFSRAYLILNLQGLAHISSLTPVESQFWKLLGVGALFRVGPPHSSIPPRIKFRSCQGETQKNGSACLLRIAMSLQIMCLNKFTPKKTIAENFYSV